MDLAITAKHWLQQQLPTTISEITGLLGDAGFRRYYRIHSDGGSYILMCCPPDKLATAPFVEVGRLFASQGITVPEIIAWDEPRGFLLLTDFGDDILLSKLKPQTVNDYYQQAFTVLHRIQTCSSVTLPVFNEQRIITECSYFEQWYVQAWLGLSLSIEDKAALAEVYQQLLACSLAQPQVCIHRDYHSRNLMCLADGQLGVLDFQDAMRGPVSYDLVSLVKDCYIDWSNTQVDAWVESFFQQYQAQHYSEKVDYADFYRWFTWQGLQRHLKVLGIFARLALRDGKDNYLQYIPRILNYIQPVIAQYSEFTVLQRFCDHALLARRCG